MKRVKQISLDIMIGLNVDGEALAQEVANELVRRGYMVVGASFQGDMTEVYEEHYSDLLEEV